MAVDVTPDLWPGANSHPTESASTAHVPTYTGFGRDLGARGAIKLYADERDHRPPWPTRCDLAGVSGV